MVRYRGNYSIYLNFGVEREGSINSGVENGVISERGRGREKREDADMKEDKGMSGGRESL